MNVRKVVAGSVLAAGLGVAGLFGAGMASADVTNNGTTNDSTGFGVTNHMKNAFNGDHTEHRVGTVHQPVRTSRPSWGRRADADARRRQPPGDRNGDEADFGPINDNNPTRVGNGR